MVIASYVRRPKVYLAAPLFNDAERAFNSLVARELEAIVDVYLPQRDGGLMSEMVAAGIEESVAVCRVFKRDIDAILQSDGLIAILDGRAIDEGLAFELGVAFAHSKRCVGLQTDCRRLAPWGNNPMITGAIEAIFNTIADLRAWTHSELGSKHIRNGPMGCEHVEN